MTAILRRVRAGTKASVAQWEKEGMSAQSPIPHTKASADRLGGTITIGGDMTVHRLGFGAMRLCGPGVWGDPLDPSAAKRVLTHAVELGITLIDTADAYGPEVNERFIAETLYPYPEGLVIATKGGLTRPRRGAWSANGRPEHLRAACEASSEAVAAGADRSLSAARARSTRAAGRLRWRVR